jgi:uncharacterized membrane protein
MASPTQGPTKLGVQPNVGGLLCYAPCCIGVIFSIVVAIVEKESRFLRFHAFQSLLIHGAYLALSVVLWIGGVMFTIVRLGALGGLIMVFHWIIGLAVLGLLIFLMIKAYGLEEFEVPTIGQMARKWV